MADQRLTGDRSASRPGRESPAPGVATANAIRWLGVLSDTHGDVASTTIAVREFQLRQVQLVAHCGDIGSPRIPALLAPWPTHFVLGNVDGNFMMLREAIEQQAAQTLHGRFGALTAGNRRIALIHSDDERLFRETVHSGCWDLVCYGHTHRAEHHFEAGTLVVNPGAIHCGFPPSVAVIDLVEMVVTSVPLTEI